eukprot:TRINITY_DN11179_c0_g1_i1.p1 TRINITY_DN11179_c0_g1~~TRINITY_DN11179_c0_g1_i1.p1  ORF type:complete len:709 (+),score=132.01 TRINITY_DN11179_c0_g1_i1:59-2128(+)
MLPEEIDQLRVVDLKAELDKRGLSTKGLKAELAKRLREAVGSGDGSDAPAPGEGEGEGEAKGTEEEAAAAAPAPEPKPEPEKQGSNDAPPPEDSSAPPPPPPPSAAAPSAVPPPSNPPPATTHAAPSSAPTDAPTDTTPAPTKDNQGDEADKPAVSGEGGGAAATANDGEDREGRKRSRSRTRDRSPKRARGDEDRRSRDRRSHDRYNSRDRRDSRERHGSRDRRGDRDRYRRSRSRSHGRRRRRSPSRSESPPRQRKRQWDIGPNGEITEPLRGAALPPPGGPMPAAGGAPGGVGVGAVHPSRLGAVGAAVGATPMVPNVPAPMPNPDVAAQQASALADRPARRLYCGGVPNGVTQEQLVEFFDAALVAAQFAQPGSVIGAHVHVDRNFAFIEFKDKETCTKAMIFDGITLQNSPLKLRRPRDYIPEPGESAAPHIPGRISSVVPDGPHKIYLGGLSQQLGAEQIKELLQAFGPLQAFNLVTDSSTGLSRGFAFCEFVDKSLTEVAVKGLNGMEIMGRNITVQMANSSSSGGGGGGGGRGTSASGSGANLAPLGSGPGQSFAAATAPAPGQGHAPSNPMPSAGYGRDPAGPPSTVLRLDNMITPDDLKDDEEYNDILADIKEECSHHGVVRDVVIPRDGPGMLKVFVHFDTDRSAMRALTSLQGRKFGGQTVVASYYDPGRFSQGQLM